MSIPQPDTPEERVRSILLRQGTPSKLILHFRALGNNSQNLAFSVGHGISARLLAHGSPFTVWERFAE
jgi:hypothetical protein